MVQRTSCDPRVSPPVGSGSRDDVEHDLAAWGTTVAAPPRRRGTTPAQVRRGARRRPRGRAARAAPACPSTATPAPARPRYRPARRATCAGPRRVPERQHLPVGERDRCGVRHRPPSTSAGHGAPVRATSRSPRARTDSPPSVTSSEAGVAAPSARRPLACARRAAARAGMPSGRLRPSVPPRRRRSRAGRGPRRASAARWRAPPAPARPHGPAPRAGPAVAPAPVTRVVRGATGPLDGSGARWRRPRRSGPRRRARAGRAGRGRRPTARPRWSRSAASPRATRGVDAAEYRLRERPIRPALACAARRGAATTQPRVAVDEVGEARREAAEADPPRRAGVGGDDLLAA